MGLYYGFCHAELYNLQRPHQGIAGLVLADRFFGAAPEVLRTLRERVAANALELARHGRPSNPFYLTGQVGDRPFSVHAEGARVILTGGQGRQEIDLVPPPAAKPAAPLPEPLCPAGVVLSGTGPEAAGGQTPETALPEGVRPDLAQAPAAAPGGEA